MMKPLYILSSSAISPQYSFEHGHFLKPLVHTSDGKLFVIDADYRQYINPVAIRRMSRQMKMGISTAMQALKEANITEPDAIITGTGLGSMTDMEHFLKDMISMDEQALNPTYFIQSTYNSINGWISLQTKSTGYNQTYVHRGLSLELSLLDAQLLLSENEAINNVLVGCFDELTPDYFLVKSKCNYWKDDVPNSRELLKYNNTPGTIAGEGTAFFSVSSQEKNALCYLQGIMPIQHIDNTSIRGKINDFLAVYQLTPDDMDIVITGMNGDCRFQPFYDEALQTLSSSATVVCFKHMTGEYPTASGFALWLAVELFRKQTIPEEIIYHTGNSNRKKIRNILVLNHYILDTASLMLLSIS